MIASIRSSIFKKFRAVLVVVVVVVVVVAVVADVVVAVGVGGMAEPFKSAAPLSVPRRVRTICFN